MDYSNTKIVSFVAVFIALLALMVSIHEGYEIRRHNRLNVKPYLDTKKLYKENHSFTLSIKNGGLGPAIVEEFSIYANDKEMQNWNNAMDEIGITKFSRFTHFSKGEIIPEGFHTDILQIDTVLTNFNLKFFLKYHSVYEEKFELELSF